MLIISKDGARVLNMDNVMSLEVRREYTDGRAIVAETSDGYYPWEIYPTPELALGAMKCLISRIEFHELSGKHEAIKMPTDTEAQIYLDKENEP